MRTIFNIEWENLELQHVRDFLANAGEEGVTWEAKAEGQQRLRPEVVRRAVCGLANQIGGVVIVGAQRGGEAWELPGVETPRNETGLWVDQVLSGLRPVPLYRHKHWPVGDGRVIAAIQVQPVVLTPCMTSDGQVFERVAGETIRVTDPTRLHELLARGQRARERAEAISQRAAKSLSPGPYEQLRVRLILGLAATNYEPDIGARLFHSRFRVALEERVQTRVFEELHSEPVGEASSFIQQDHIQWAAEAKDAYWVVRPTWDGSVAVLAALKPGADALFSFMDYGVWPAWKLAVDLVELLGGYGPAHVSFIVDVRNQSVALPDGRNLPPFGEQGLFGRLRRETLIERETEIAEPSSEEIGSVQRELLRAAGYWRFEGAPDPPEEFRG
jgi:hypothetical protein